MSLPDSEYLDKARELLGEGAEAHTIMEVALLLRMMHDASEASRAIIVADRELVQRLIGDDWWKLGPVEELN